MSDSGVKKFALLFLVIGAGLLVGALISGLNSFSLLREGVRTTGNVVDFNQGYDDEGDMMYTPVFTFLDEQGSQHQVTSRVSRSSPGYRRGEAVTVIYRRSSPENAEIQSLFGLWGVAGILTIIGVGFVFFGVLALIMFGRVADTS